MKLKEVNYDNLSPMMKQYYEIKSNYENILLFYRLGDFYELFFEDAEIASRELGLTLTGKNAGLEERVPMCGAPHHSIKTYIQSAIEKGFKVAICEQMEEAKASKKMVRREVTEVISKGTLTDLDFLDNKDFNYLGSVVTYPASYAVVYADISTGELNGILLDKEEKKLLNTILNNSFKEVLCDSKTNPNLVQNLRTIYNIDVTVDDNFYDEDLHIENIEVDKRLEKSVRHLFYYLNKYELKNISHFKTLNILDGNNYLSMDVHTIRNLELLETLRLKERQNSLLWLIDKCKTSMGSRKLKSWVLKPLRNIEVITERQNKIEILNKSFIQRSELARELYEIYDIERLCGKVASNSANARDLLQLNNSLKVLPRIAEILKELKFPYEIETFAEISNKISKAISKDAPITLKDGYIIKDGYDTELDELRSIRSGGKNFITSIEREAQEETGISNLKIGYNKIFGYYIEVTKSNVSKIRPELGWERKQTLVGAERYVSPQLKEKEDIILNAEEKIIELEYNIFINIRNEIKDIVTDLIKMADTISEIDALYSLSIASEDLKLVRPILNNTGDLKIISGRHPVVEHVSSKEYVPNDIIMDSKTNTLLITGPNMSGKSTYMRELAIIVILAQIGSFVPADSANLPIFDKIFTRIGASDDLVSGESTFMVEMKEAVNAIENATDKSLILFDELGRGTATYDGMAIAKAILEYINVNIKCKTLFSTHYHELTNLENEFQNIKNIHVSAEENGEDIIFLHKIKKGPADKSYGIHVAKLSGMPTELISRADEILSSYENKEQSNENEVKNEQIKFNFSDNKNSKLEKYISNLDIDSLSPRDALDAIYIAKEML